MVDERIKPSMLRLCSHEYLEGEFMQKLKDPNFKGVRIKSQSIVQYFNRILQYGYLCEITKEKFMDNPIVIYFLKNSVFVDTINDKLGQLTNGGLIDYWHKAPLYKNLKNPTSLPKVLTLHHLIGTFYILWTGFVIAFGAFVMEKVLHKTRRS